MEHFTLTFQNIMQTKILYFDDTLSDACKAICDHLKIDNMPAIDGVHYYEKDKQTFIKKRINEKQKVFVHQSIFDQNLIEKFENNNHNVLFVFEGKVLNGIVHFSDYNKDKVLQHIQDDILSLERKLRQLILLNGKENQDIKLFFEERLTNTKSANKVKYYTSKIEYYNRQEEIIKSLGQFQIFDFSDLLEFVNSKFSGTIHKSKSYSINNKSEPSAEVLRKLRNLAMHGKDPIERDIETGIFSIDSLKILFHSLNALKDEHYDIHFKIKQHKDYLKSIELDNRNKLDIIHTHHPSALEYFLEW